MEIIEQVFGEFFITTDKSKLDIVAIHDFLSNYSGWSDNIPLEKAKISIENSASFIPKFTKERKSVYKVVILGLN